MAKIKIKELKQLFTEHGLDEGMFENLAPALYAVQQVADDIKELERHVTSEPTKFVYIPIICNFYGDINTESYVPFSDGETESTANSNRRNQFIAFSMMFTYTYFINSFSVFCCWIALIIFPIIYWEFFI